jgi:hypothetical protein
VRLRLLAALLALVAGAAALIVVILLVRSALADADPASDILVGSNVFYPYSPPVSADLQNALNAETTAASRVRFPIKVALIDRPPDLGALPVLFDKPQQYATFLDQEFGFLANPHPPLLVVMPDGYGVAGLPPAATAAARALPKPAGNQVNDLARAAIVGVRRLAAAAGHILPRITTSADGGGANSRPLIIGAVVVGALATAAAVIATRRRRSLGR